MYIGLEIKSVLHREKREKERHKKMICGLKVYGMHKIDVNSSGHISVNGEKLNIADIPYVKYQFDKYDDEQMEYIDEYKKILKYSCHIVSLNIRSESVARDIQSIEQRFNSESVGIFKILYIPIDYSMHDSRDITSEDKLIIQSIVDSGVIIDRVQLYDTSNNLTMEDILDIEGKVAKYFGDTLETNVGVCHSPYSSIEGQCCLPAQLIREWQSYLDTNETLPLVSVNHENKLDGVYNCGCVRYAIVCKDTDKCPNKKVTGDKKNTGEQKDKPAKKKIACTIQL